MSQFAPLVVSSCRSTSESPINVASHDAPHDYEAADAATLATSTMIAPHRHRRLSSSSGFDDDDERRRRRRRRRSSSSLSPPPTTRRRLQAAASRLQLLLAALGILVPCGALLVWQQTQLDRFGRRIAALEDRISFIEGAVSRAPSTSRSLAALRARSSLCSASADYAR